MNKMSWIVGMALVAAVACSDSKESGTVGTSGATSATDNPAPTGATITDGDRSFVNDLAIANMAEVDLGKLATEHSSNPDVKKFGQMMIDDHTQAGHKLETVASAHNIAVPTAIDEKHRELHDKLAGLRGSAFDQEYASAMADGHEDVLSKLESRIDGAVLADWKAKFGDALRSKSAETRQPPPVTPETSDNPVTMAINQWAAEAYPTVFKHTESAKTLEDAVKRTQRSQ